MIQASEWMVKNQLVNQWMNNLTNYTVNKHVVERIIMCVNEWLNESANEWMGAWISQPESEWMVKLIILHENEWLNKWINEWIPNVSL